MGGGWRWGMIACRFALAVHLRGKIWKHRTMSSPLASGSLMLCMCGGLVVGLLSLALLLSFAVGVTKP